MIKLLLRVISIRDLRRIILDKITWTLAIKSCFSSSTFRGILFVSLSGFLGLLLGGEAQAAPRYWVGGCSTANWDCSDAGPVTNWGSASGLRDNVSVPGSSDDVFFDGSANGDMNSTISADITIKSLDMTGWSAGTTRTLTHTAAKTLTISGGGVVFKLASGMTYTLGDPATSALSFTGTSGTTLITTAGKILGNVTFNGAGGAWQLQDAFTATGGTITFSGGTLDTNSKTVVASKFSSQVGTRTLSLGSSSLTFSGNGRSVYALGTFTVPANTATMTLNNVTNSIFESSAKDWNGMSLVFSGGGTGSTNNSGNLTLANLTRTGSALKTDTLVLGSNTTLTGTLTVNGNSSINRVLVTSDALGTPRTITAANTSFSNVDFRDITGAGAGNWDLHAITGLSGDALGNSGITFTTAVPQFWTGETGSWSVANQWCTSSGGCADNAGNGRVPLPQDDATFDNGSFSGTGKTVTLDMPRAGRSVDWSAYTEGQTPNWVNTVQNTLYGSLTLISGMTVGLNQHDWLEGRAAGMPAGGWKLNTAGKALTNRFYIQMVGGTLSLQDNYSSDDGLYVYAGTFNTNNFDIVAKYFWPTATAYTTVLNLGSSTLTLSGTSVQPVNMSPSATLNAGTSHFVISGIAGAKTFEGGGKTYHNVTFSGDNITVSDSNTFNTIAVNNAGLANGLIFTSGTTQTVTNFTTNATSTSARAIIKSSSAAPATITKAGGGNISVDYMNPTWITGTPASTWYMGSHSLDGGNNSGLIFADLPSSAKAITAFDFNALSPAVVGVVNEGAKTISLTVPYGTNVTALVPTITVTGASVSPNTGVAHDFTTPQTYTVTADDASTQEYVVTVTAALNTAKAITAFDFNTLSPAVVGAVNEGAKTISLTVPYGTNITALVPTITVTGASVSPNTGVAHDFTTPQTYTVTAADSSTQNYAVTVTVSTPTVQNLGVQFQTIGLDGSFMFLDGNGDKHWFGAYAQALGGVNTQFLDVNMTTGAKNYFDTGKEGRGNVYGKASYGNKFYIATNDPCYLREYDVAGGTYTQRSAAGWAANKCGLAATDKTVQQAYTAPDGVMYFGTATRGTVFEVNPSTGAVRDFGVTDAPDGNPTCSGCYRYVSSLAADANYVYAGMRDANTNAWWLAILNRSDGSLSASCWKNDGFTSGAVRNRSVPLHDKQ